MCLHFFLHGTLRVRMCVWVGGWVGGCGGAPSCNSVRAMARFGAVRCCRGLHCDFIYGDACLGLLPRCALANSQGAVLSALHPSVFVSRWNVLCTSWRTVSRGDSPRLSLLHFSRISPLATRAMKPCNQSCAIGRAYCPHTPPPPPPPPPTTIVPQPQDADMRRFPPARAIMNG